jgi:hypothetical protein
MGKLIAKIYPMKHVCDAFIDAVSGKKVSYYRQIDGKIVMAESRFGFFRVPAHGSFRQ